jgi:pimeloyl-ACP methyl ester carboxylesterase
MTITINYRYAFDKDVSNAPLLILMHGFSDSNTNFNQSAMERMAGYGFFVVAPNLRATKDASGREIHDIADCVANVRAKFPNFIHADRNVIAGYSGGGGNALNAACKFPDLWTTVISHFGMSDYGYNNPSGWWYQNAAFQAALEIRIGGTPAAVPENYRARNARDGIKNFSGGELFLLHDADDSSVNINQSQLLADAMDAFGMSNHTENYTNSGSTFRWLHGYPNSNPLAQAENVWYPSALENPAWTIPATGTIRVIGYIVTKRFEIWLGGLTEAAAGAGRTEVADVTYNTNTGEYEITPLTGNMDVFIRQGVLDAAQSITGVTTLTVT